MHRIAAVTLVVLVATLLSSCGGGPSPATHGPGTYDPGSPCSELAKTCHGKSGDLAEQCHYLGHEGETGACAEKHDACLAACAK